MPRTKLCTNSLGDGGSSRTPFLRNNHLFVPRHLRAPHSPGSDPVINAWAPGPAILNVAATIRIR